MGPGPFVVLAALVAGVLAGARLGPGDGVTAAVVAAAAAVAAFGLRPGWARLAAAAVIACSAGIALEARALDGLVHHPLTRVVDARADATLDVELTEDPEGSRFRTSALARVSAARTGGRARDAGGRTILVVAEGEAATRFGLLDAGDHARLVGWLRPLDGFDRRLAHRHAVARFDATALLALQDPTGLLWRVANPVRTTVLRGIAPLPATDRALVAGFLLGDTRDLPEPVLEQFRASGLSHLLAVSGANVAFVLALAGPALRRLPRSARLLATLVVLAAFGAMTRWEPSVLRASAMAACAVIAVHVGRPAQALRVLAIAVSALVVADPFLVRSVGFQLSCGASLGIAALGPRLAARLPGPAWFADALATTAAAQLGVAPVLLAVFGSIPLVSVPANLLAAPIAGPLTTWGLAAGSAGGLLGPVAPGIGRALQLPTLVLAEGVLGIADLAARVPLALDATSALVGTAVVALAALAGRARRLRRDALVVPPG